MRPRPSHDHFFGGWYGSFNGKHSQDDLLIITSFESPHTFVKIYSWNIYYPSIPFTIWEEADLLASYNDYHVECDPNFGGLLLLCFLFVGGGLLF